MKHRIEKEKRIAKIMFWCLTPLFFAVFMRLFFIIFKFIYGTFLIFILGQPSANIMTVTALLLSLFFTVAVCFFMWKQFKKHILES